MDALFSFLKLIATPIDAGIFSLVEANAEVRPRDQIRDIDKIPTMIFFMFIILFPPLFSIYIMF